MPVTTSLARVDRDKRSDFTFIVGSDAIHTNYWPTVESDLDEDEVKRIVSSAPAEKSGDPLANRSKTKAQRLRANSELEENPVLKAFVKARMVVDLQKREDVRGDYTGLASAFEDVWGMLPGDLRLDTHTSVDATESLARYAVAVDTAFPQVMAPIHERRVVASVFTGGTR